MITSLQNILIKRVVALRDSKERRASGLTIIDGAREIERAIDAGIIIKHLIYCDKCFAGRGESEVLHKANKLSVETNEVSDQVFAKIAFGEHTEGLLAIAQTPVITLEKIRLSKTPLILVIEAVEKPGNLGAILRSADAAGVEAVFICDAKTDIYNPNIIRASTGVIFSLPVIAATSECVKVFLNSKGIAVIAADPLAKEIYTKIDYRKAVAFVLGTEDKGLSDFWMKASKQKVSIPMKGKADSLNVSVTSALLVYEALRQRQG